MLVNGEHGGSRALFDRWARTSLTWLPEWGVGHYPVQDAPYDAAYFAKYQRYAETKMGRDLNTARLAMLDRHWQDDGLVVDIGIGCGQFVASRPGTMGYDVNPSGVAWLLDRGLFVDPYQTPVNVACFFDSLEHIADPAPLLANVIDLALVAIPIFTDLAHVLQSRHLRFDEHHWYMTEAGLLHFMAAHGFDCVERNFAETELGREDIESFAFRRQPCA